MNVTLTPRALRGSVRAVPSKSHVHRLLICAGLGDKPASLECRVISRDILATAGCLTALGARAVARDGRVDVTPARGAPRAAELDPGESGSTYRFFTPLVSALGVEATFSLHGKLPSRPMDDLWREMERHGVTVVGKGTARPALRGRLTPGEYRLPGGVSSQFFSGLLFSLPLLGGDSEIAVAGRLESAGYVDLTLDALRAFGVRADFDGARFAVPGGQRYATPPLLAAEGDWSNSAFWLCSAAARGDIAVEGLELPSLQGDSAVVDILREFGAQIDVSGGTVRARQSALRGIKVDARDVPDLVPALAVAAMAARGRTTFFNAGRLRLKESDRVASVCAAVRALGGRAFDEGDALSIEGGAPCPGGAVDACGDHRVAMLAAAASPLCSGAVRIDGAQAVDKSYPGFFDDLAALGGVAEARED